METEIIIAYRDKIKNAGPSAQESLFREMAEAVLSHRRGANSGIMQMMKMELAECSYREQSITLRFPVEHWQLNPLNTMHGGLSATACDSTGGLLTRIAAFTGITPTVSLNMNYLSPILENTHLMIKARVEHLGKTLVQISMDGWIEETGKPAVMATGIYMPKASA
ncbi:PaaI family thioesterase [Ruminococcus sp. OA3]|uniref:PaaI family thioesterase n=1 Tax=Ruminococcus sp. OA3 TaxID=2914164 RepID=UPI001F065C16|nr:PaaI family thioesterase [Ruminococcus sp. OA3]MCH1981035.1 PaaI family thioesterase [Ruminococcus sp. OA3]